MSFYAVLGVPVDADERSIRRAFRSLVRRYHPDAGKGSSPEKFRQIVEAYQNLSDPERRRIYDRSLRGTPPPEAIFVEPMVAHVEPMVRRRHYSSSIYASPIPPTWSAQGPGELLEELWRALEHDFFFRAFRSRW